MSEKFDRERLKKVVDELILSQKEPFYGYQITKMVFAKEEMSNPSHSYWTKVHILVSERIKFLEEVEKIKFLHDEPKGSRYRKIYEVVK
jgi:hypothetical protein